MIKRLLVLLLLIVSCNSAHAYSIDLPNYISGNDVTIANLQLTNTTLEDVINGGISGNRINITAGSINTSDLAQAVSPIVRWNESFNDYTVSGMLPATSGSLTSDISAGVSYVNGYRIELPATSHTYSVSKDTYVYMNEGGYYVFQEVANGGATPATPNNSLLLARVVTGGSTISSVSDLRTLSIQITTTTTNFPADYRDQAFVSRDTTTAFHVEPGSMAIGTTIYTRTTDTSQKTITTSSNWIEGTYSPGPTARVFVYAYNDAGSTWDFKYSTQDVTYSDTSGNANGILRYYTTGGVTYRAVGWFYLSADVTTGQDWGNFSDIGVTNSAERQSSASRAITDTSYRTAITGTEINFYSSGKPLILQFLGSGQESTGITINSIFSIDGSTVAQSEQDLGGTGSNTPVPVILNYRAVLTQGMHRINPQIKINTGTYTFSKSNIIIREE